ncbi:MAG: hypothetical protein V4475_08145 [Pseudomonadota bacterium]
MLAAPEPRPAQLKTGPSAEAGARAADSSLATLLDAAPPVQRLRRLGAVLNAGHPPAPVQRAVAVVQRLTDGGNPVTTAMVAAENNLATLQRWKDLADDDWAEHEMGVLIAARIGVLQAAAAQQQAAAAQAAQQQAAAAAAALAQQQAAAAALAAQQAAQAEMTADQVPAAAFDYPTYQILTARNLRRAEKAAFFIAGGANAAAACAAIVAAGQSDAAAKKALIAYGRGANQAQATRIAGVYDTVRAWSKYTIDVDALEELIGEGVLGYHETEYQADAREAGAYYVFSFVHLDERVNPEWHIHIGVHNAVKSGSWKSQDGRMAHGANARVPTDAATNRRLSALLR